jgi:hypothetical protein
LEDAALVALANPGLVRRAAKLAGSVTLENGGARALVGEFAVELSERGPEAARCPCPAAGICVHVLAASMALRATAPADWAACPDGQTPAGPGGIPSTAPQPLARGRASTSIPPGATSGRDSARGRQPQTGPTPATRAVTKDVRQQVARLTSTGLSHLGGQSAEALADLAAAARTAGLALLARHLGSTAGLIRDFAARSDQVAEPELASSLARLWALSTALDAAGPERWQLLQGKARRSFEEAGESLTLLPLGAAWWENPSGARGITLFTWDAKEGEIRAAVAARPAGTDPRFRRGLDCADFWGVPLDRLLAGPFEVHDPRLAADGGLSTTGRATPAEAGGWSVEGLNGIVQRLDGEDRERGLAARGWTVALLAVRGAGAPVIDEPGQELVWPLELAGGDGRAVLTQPVDAASEKRIDMVLALAAAGRPVTHVLARRIETRWEPVSVFERQKGGAAKLVALDFAAPGKGKSPARAALALMRRRRGGAVPLVVRPAVAVVCDQVKDLVVEVAATGRAQLSPAQRARRDRLAVLCEDLGLTTLGAAARGIENGPSAGGLLRAQYLADQVAELCLEVGGG